MIPYFSLGIFIGHTQIYSFLKKNWEIPSLFSFVGLLFFLNFDVFFSSGIGSFAYAGFKLFVLTFLIVTLFYIFPFEKLPQSIKECISKISKFSLGIYCVHWGVGQVGNQIKGSSNFTVSSKFYVLLIYLISLLISFLISSIPFKFCKGLVE